MASDDLLDRIVSDQTEREPERSTFKSQSFLCCCCQELDRNGWMKQPLLGAHFLGTGALFGTVWIEIVAEDVLDRIERVDWARWTQDLSEQDPDLSAFESSIFTFLLMSRRFDETTTSFWGSFSGHWSTICDGESVEEGA